MRRKDVLVFDIETDSLDPETANMRFFGAYSYADDKYHVLEEEDHDLIQQLLNRHGVLVSYNGEGFDVPILQNNGYDVRYNVSIDLLRVSKQRLGYLGIKTTDFKLKTVIDALQLDFVGKGDMEYSIFKKTQHSAKERAQIEKYLKQDVEITKKLFEYYLGVFAPLAQLLPGNDRNRFADLNSSAASIAYKVVCHKAGLKPQFGTDTEVAANKRKFSGGHHIEPQENKYKGHLVSFDFTSQYPHAIIQGNLLSPKKGGWSGGGVYDLAGSYDTAKQGKAELALREIFLERLKAKREGDTARNKSYKIVINSFYGLVGNPRFKTLYSPEAAADTTKCGRSWLKRLAACMQVNGFEVVYGFTDSVLVKIPPGSSKEQAIACANHFIQEEKKLLPFPMDTFGLEIEKELKFIWFAAKNVYLWVDTSGEVHKKSGLLNKNTPPAVKEVYEGYIKPKISSQLDVNFTKTELERELRSVLAEDITKAAQTYTVKEPGVYRVKTSLPAQVAQTYGPGKHHLIPNMAGVGVGKDVTQCTPAEFEEAGLTVDDIDMAALVNFLKPFYKKKKGEQNAKTM